MHKRGALPLPVPTFAVVMADAISLASASPSGEVTVQEAAWNSVSLCNVVQRCRGSRDASGVTELGWSLLGRSPSEAMLWGVWL